MAGFWLPEARNHRNREAVGGMLPVAKAKTGTGHARACDDDNVHALWVAQYNIFVR